MQVCCIDLLHHGQPRTPLDRLGSEKTRLRRAHEFVHANFMRDFSIDELSRAAGLSRFHLMRAFDPTPGRFAALHQQRQQASRHRRNRT